MIKKRNFILFAIVLAQFFCTSLWFAGNAVAVDLSQEFSLGEGALGMITSVVQFGFISGTLLFAFLKVSDRFSPSIVFFLAAFCGSAANLSVTFLTSPDFLLPLRFLTGFFLAGIYPVGMKIASDYNNKGLGLALGYLVGALVLGTASPYLLKDFFIDSSWQNVFYATSGLAMFGGGVIGFAVPDGPYRTRSSTIDFSAFFRVFIFSKFRTAAFGYFGHMWELYAFWAFVPVYLHIYFQKHEVVFVSISMASFLAIGIGLVSCIFGGYFSRVVGSEKVAAYALFTSLICCCLSPFMLNASPVIFFFFLMIWGMTVIMDSPQFSTLVARYAPAESRGTALTIVNSVGFAITIVSIQMISHFKSGEYMYYVLIPGPLIGLLFFYPSHVLKNEGL